MKVLHKLTLHHFLLFSLLPFPSLGDVAIKSGKHNNVQAACTDKLNILLSNDDGFNKPGIVALQTALHVANHRVMIAAPAKNVSGSSASITFAPVSVKQVANDIYAIDASPASSVLLAVSTLFSAQNPPDLIISGINKGANLGPATGISGTVGVTTAAIQLIDPPIPAIAISTDPLRHNFSEQENQAHLQRIADFVVNLIDELIQEKCKSGLLLPRGLALNINYPPIPRKDIKGVVIKEQGQTPYFHITYKLSKDNANVFLPAFKTKEIKTDIKHSDTLAYQAGYITIVPLNGNYTSKDPSIKTLIQPIILKLNGFTRD